MRFRFAVGWGTVWTAGFAAEAAAGTLLLRGAPVTVWTAWHGAAVLLWGAGLLLRDRLRSRRDTLQTSYTFVWLLTTFFPFLGVAAAVLFFLVVRTVGREDLEAESPAALELRQETAPRGAGGEALLRRVRREAGFESYADILLGENVRLKIQTVEKLSKSDTRTSVALLRQALHDPVPEIRLFSAGALLKMEERMNERIENARKAVQSRGAARDYLELAELYRHYVEAWQPEPALARHYWEQAAQAYRDALDLETDQPQAVVRYGQVMLRLNKPERARSLVERAAGLWPDDPEIFFLRNEVAFRLGRLREVAEHLEREGGRFSEEALGAGRKEVVALWRNGT